MRRGLALSALLAMSVGHALAGYKTDFAAEFKRIQSSMRNGLSGGRINQATVRETQKKASADYEELAKKAETTDLKTMTPEDMSAVAQANSALKKYDAAVKWADLAIKADPKIPSGHEAKVRAL